MSEQPDSLNATNERFPSGEPVNISRRRFLMASAGMTAGALVLGFGLPVGQARAGGFAGDSPGHACASIS